MNMKVHMALAVSGLVFAGGTALVGSPAKAATFTSHEGVTVAPHGVTYSALGATHSDRLIPPTCRRHVRGHYVHRRGRTVYMPGYWLPRGCRHR